MSENDNEHCFIGSRPKDPWPDREEHFPAKPDENEPCDLPPKWFGCSLILLFFAGIFCFTWVMLELFGKLPQGLQP